MAKPKHGRGDNHIGLISLSSPVPRSHVRPFPRVPSPAVLSALALIATTPSAVAGGPLPTTPPSFLCPSIERDHIDPSPHTHLTLPPRTPPSVPSVSPFAQHRTIADKYVQGSDSLWRKAAEWTLYGSTCCSSSTASTSGTLSQPTSSSTPSPVQFDTSMLPAGWDSATNPNSSTESTIILALAIVLASSICVFMIGCIFWRRRRKKTRDAERKLDAAHDSHDTVREKDARGKMRIWARASARWKSNIRQSARRRRRRPVASSTDNRPLSPTLSDSPQVSIVVPSTPSRRSSFVSRELDPSTPEAVSCLDGNTTESPSVPHDHPHFVSPPTYGASFAPTLSGLPPSSAASNPTLTSSPDNPNAAQRSDLPSFTEDEPLPYIPPREGHIAIDDKAQLAHIRGLASSPPTNADAASASAMQSVSAPEWHEVEDDLENWAVDLSGVPMSFHNFGSPPSFPPPPSKADIPFAYLDEHPHGERDVILVLPPIPGPSGPPLGTSPSAPSLEDPGLEPSAPSLEGEDDLFQDWDGISSSISEVPTAADPGPTPTCVVESSLSSTASSASGASFPSIQESTARDGILPRYYP